MLRFVIVVPITTPGSDPAGRPLRRPRRTCAPRAPRPGARTNVTELAADVPTIPVEQSPSAPPAQPRAWYADQDKRELAVWGAVARPRPARALHRARRAPVPPRREPGRVLLVPVPADRRLRVQPAAARPAALLPDGADVRAVRRLGLHRPPRPGADGHGDGPDVLAAAAPARPRSRRSPPRCCFAFGAELPVLQPLRPRGHLLRRRSRSRSWSRSGASSTTRASTTRR